MDTRVPIKRIEFTLRGRFVRLIDTISQLDTIISASFLAIIVLLMVYGVITRYVFNSPCSWVEEASLSLFVWMTFMGASALMRNDELVRIDYISTKLPIHIAKFFDNLIRPMLVIFALIFMAYWGWKLLMFSQIRFTPALQIPYIYIYAAIPISSIFMIYHQLKQLRRFFRSGNKEH